MLLVFLRDSFLTRKWGCPQLAFVTTTSDSYRQIKLWTQYHQSLGVGRFYLFVDGQARARRSLRGRGSGRRSAAGGRQPARRG